MIGRVVEIAGDSRYLHKERGFLVVSHRGAEQGRVPLDDIAALICNAHGLVYSNNLLVALVERGCPIVLCGKNHMPAGIICAVDSHHRQGARLDAQAAASLPTKKRLWQELIRKKLGMQAATLGAYGLPEPPLRALIPKVTSGDARNMEGVGARRYWRLLFGHHFRREQDGEGINAMLNYGYTVLRATVARHLLATGLHPGMPLHHANDANALRLVDDVMEPFRPLVDAQVRQLADLGRYDVDTPNKRELSLMMARGIQTEEGLSPVSVAIERLCVSLAQVFEKQRKHLALPYDRAESVSAWLGNRASFGNSWSDNGADETLPPITEEE
ncbi:MAG: type II CRISPR-associated endonuclease Cas1 [Thermomonas sp.]|uniref:type II CRISPR-associated endonuclease Cas1 n=1 Tax=Thermomonas sp. TaxID=1971895 RepID=UPI001EB9E58D|nr:type II CRISPR-associated endonuclease Cas1 [Thermomonas sp.]MBV2208966.1 type II CRISPR-associated endonuclease Cas1 [Thermomonas sp.]